MTIITKRKALSLLDKAVKEKGEDHIVPVQGCVYMEQAFDNDTEEDVVLMTPSCIVGNSFVRLLGADKAFDIFSGNVPDGPVNSTAVGVLWDYFERQGVHVTKGARQVFDAAQMVQDGRGEHMYGPKTWGSALEAAKRV